MIHLQEDHYLSQGGFQKCYFHPEKENLCIKIKKDASHKDARVDREIEYYKKIQKKRDSSIEYIAKYHGKISTNLGEGDVFDLIKDETTNNASLTMRDYMRMENSPISDDIFLRKLRNMKEKMIKHKIVARDIKAQNICCKILMDNSVELILIDGVGHRDFIPFVNWFSFFTERKMNKIFDKKKLNSINEHRNYLDTLQVTS